MNLVLKTGVTGKKMVQITKILVNLLSSYFKFDAITAEINPLIIDTEGNAIAADAKFEIDDSALYRVRLGRFGLGLSRLWEIDRRAKL